MARARVTLRDVAQRVGVHPSTVSRVLNPATRAMVTEAIVQRVVAAAETLGYHPNPIAYGLKTNRSLTVGVLIPDLTNPIFPPIIRGIEDVFAAAGYTAILANTDNDDEREGVILRNMLARHIEGLILATSRRRDPIVEQCLADDIPVVLINRTTETGHVPSVINDDVLGMRLIVAHMVARGHTRIAHVAGPLDLSTGFARHKAFIEAMKAHHLKPDPKLIINCSAFSEEEGRRAFLELWSRNHSFTAVVAANDLLALGCYDALLALGIQVPEDVSVSGFNDMPFLDKLRPPLTTVRIPLYEMGTQAAKSLLLRMQNRETPVPSITLEPTLVVRGSTADAHAIAKTARSRQRR